MKTFNEVVNESVIKEDSKTLAKRHMMSIGVLKKCVKDAEKLVRIKDFNFLNDCLMEAKKEINSMMKMNGNYSR